MSEAICRNGDGISPGKRYLVLQRSNFRCHYCGAKAGDVLLEVDHVVPSSRGGTNDIGNLVAACPSCNRGKGAKPLDGTSATTAAVDQQPPAAHPLVGLFCYELMADEELRRLGMRFNRQARIESVLGDAALLQFFSALDGYETDIEAVPVSQLTSGAWVFYRSESAWRSAGEEALRRYYVATRPR